MSVTLTIAGTDRADQVQWKSLRRDNRINNQPDTLKFSLLYGGTKTYKPSINDEVILTINGNREFGGRILRVDQRLNSSFQIEYDITCQDYVFDLNGQLVTERYTSTNVQAVILDIVSNYTSGFTTTNVSGSGLSIDSVAFNRITVAEALEKLAKLTSYSWYVDYNKDIHFFAKTEEPAPYRLTDDTSHPDYGKYIYDSLIINEDLSQLRNTILVEGGEKVGNTRSITRLGSELSSEGTLNIEYKYSSKPTVEVDSVAQTVGIDFLDDDASFDCMWSFQQKYIRFTAGNIPTSGQTIDVSGTPLYPIIVNVPEPVSVATYGTKEFAIRDKTIRSDDEAIERALAEIRAYGNELTSGSFQTYTSGLEAGQLLTIADTFRDVSEQVLIQSVQLRCTDPNGDKLEYSVKFATLKDIGIIEFLQGQLMDEELSEDEVQTLLSFLQLEDEADFTDTLDAPVTSSPPYKWSNDAETTPNRLIWNFGTWS